jgi:RNA polymerase sigma-70 factor (ECF subfamily)
MEKDLQYIAVLGSPKVIDKEDRQNLTTSERKNLFNNLYRNLYLPIYHFAKTFVDSQDAEDITADSFLKLWRSDLDLTIIPKVKTWLNVCTRNACLDLLKKKKSVVANESVFARTLQIEETNEFETEIREILFKRLEAEIEKLPPQGKKVFKMAYLEGLSSKEIAITLQISENTVSNHRVRAFQLLRLALSSYTYLLLVLPFSFCCF